MRAFLSPCTQTNHGTSRQRNHDTLRPGGRCIARFFEAKVAKQHESCAFFSLMSSRKVPFVLTSSSSTRGVTARSLKTVQCRPLTSWRRLLKAHFLQNPTCCDYCTGARHQEISTTQQLGSAPSRPGTPESVTRCHKDVPILAVGRGIVKTVGGHSNRKAKGVKPSTHSTEVLCLVCDPGHN